MSNVARSESIPSDVITEDESGVPEDHQPVGVMHRMKRFLPKSNFSRHVIMLAGGTAFAQAVVILTSPILTRLYRPEDFGVVGVYTSLLTILLTISSFQYELAIPLPVEEEKAVNILALTIAILFGSTLVLIMAYFIWGNAFLASINAPALKPYFWLLPLGLFGGGLYKILNYWALRHKAFSEISRTRVNRSVGQIFSQLGIIFLVKGPLGLFIGQLINQAGGCGTLGMLLLRRNRSTFSFISFVGMGKMAVRYRNFPLLNTWSALANAAGSQVPNILLASLFGNYVLGLYSVSLRIMFMPLDLIGQATGQVFFSRLREAHTKGHLPMMTWKVFLYLVTLSAGIFGLLASSGDVLFGMVFGSHWYMAGRYGQWLAPWSFLCFISLPLNNLVFILERQRDNMYFQIVLMLSRIGAIYFGARLFHGPNHTIQLFSALSALFWLLYLCWLMRISGNSVRVTLEIILRESLLTLLLVLPILTIRLLHGPIWLLLFGIVLSASMIILRIQHQIKSLGSP